MPRHSLPFAAAFSKTFTIIVDREIRDPGGTPGALWTGSRISGEVIMYNKQLKFQKIICLVAIILAAVYFIYSLGVITDIHDALRSTMRNKNDYTKTKVEGSIIYYEMQDFNKAFVNYSVILILIACFLFVTNTQIRRKYYIGNYVAILLFCSATVALTVWAHNNLAAYAEQYMTTVNFEQLKEYSEMWGTPYLDNTNLLDLHYYIGAFAILVVAAHIGNLIWKIVLMSAENKLIKAGKEASA